MKLKQLKTKAVYTYYYKTSKFYTTKLSSNLFKLQKGFKSFLKHSDIFIDVIEHGTQVVTAQIFLDDDRSIMRGVLNTCGDMNRIVYLKLELITSKSKRPKVKL